MLSYVPYVFELYRNLRPHLHQTMLHVCGFAGFTGECIASVRTIAASTGRSKSSVSRHLAELSHVGALTRARRPGGCYSYRPDSRFLPAAQGRPARVSRAESAASSVSLDRAEVSRGSEPAVPPLRGIKKESIETERAHGSAKSHPECQKRHSHQSAEDQPHDNTRGYVSPHDPSVIADRMHFWRRTGGLCWNPLWGPRPDDPKFTAPPRHAD